jgi:hypothetical protein
MEALLENLLAKQLTSYFQQAGGKIDDQIVSDKVAS